MSDDEIENALASFDHRIPDEGAPTTDRLEELRSRFAALRDETIDPTLRAIGDQLVDHGHLVDIHDGGSGSVGQFVDLNITRMGRPQLINARISYRFLTANGLVAVESMVGDSDETVAVGVDSISAESIRTHAANVISRLLA